MHVLLWLIHTIPSGKLTAPWFTDLLYPLCKWFYLLNMAGFHYFPRLCRLPEVMNIQCPWQRLSTIIMIMDIDHHNLFQTNGGFLTQNHPTSIKFDVIGRPMVLEHSKFEKHPLIRVWVTSHCCPAFSDPNLAPFQSSPYWPRPPSLATTDASALPGSIPAIQVIADGMGMVYGSQGLPFQNMDPNWWCSHHMARESTQGRIESTQLNQATQIASGHVHATADAPPFGAEQFVMNRHKPSRKIAGDPHMASTGKRQCHA